MIDAIPTILDVVNISACTRFFTRQLLVLAGAKE